MAGVQGLIDDKMTVSPNIPQTGVLIKVVWSMRIIGGEEGVVSDTVLVVTLLSSEVFLITLIRI